MLRPVTLDKAKQRHVTQSHPPGAIATAITTRTPLTTFVKRVCDTEGNALGRSEQDSVSVSTAKLST